MFGLPLDLLSQLDAQTLVDRGNLLMDRRRGGPWVALLTRCLMVGLFREIKNSWRYGRVICHLLVE